MLILLSNMLIFVKHPISLGMVLLSQTFMISIKSSFINSNSWFSYIIFIIMIGGLMVIFIYMTSLSNNKKFQIKTKNMTYFICLTVLITYTIYPQSNFWSKNSFLNNEINYSLNKFFSTNENMTVLFLISYLLITLIAVYNLTLIKSGPLRLI